MTGKGRPSGRTVWSVFGVLLGSCLAVAGLVVLGIVLLFAVGMNSRGSNK
jgi:hypothetical protein